MSATESKGQKSADAADVNPSVPSIPVSYPVTTLHDDLGSRVYFDSFHYPFNKASVPLKDVGVPDRRRLLVCHDMQGGYLDDKWVQGGDNADAYAIWHWHLIDVFVYFSHSLVTLPPPCWTNTAHRHGVKVLGTFIMEQDEGKAMAIEMLSTKESALKYAELLTELAVNLGFDGWLLNMEVELDADYIPNMKEFVSHLTNTMHFAVTGSLVIWYDSVTVDGRLEYQNQLNDNNKPFFDICDGIFINYAWNEDLLQKSAAVADNRKHDVYLGIDVFGRGTFGGGQWNTNVALNVLKEDDVSAAIFAPGWVYETYQPPKFDFAQNKWWSLVEDSWGALRKYPNVLPFYTNFDQGCGLHIFVDGKQVSNTEWNDNSSQGLQPFLKYNDGSDSIQVAVDFNQTSYNGGGNLTFSGTLAGNAEFTTTLFEANLPLGDSPASLTYHTLTESNSLLEILLDFSSATKGDKTTVLLASKETDQFSGRFSQVIKPHQIKSQETASGWGTYLASIGMKGYTVSRIRAFCHLEGSKSSDPKTESVPDSLSKPSANTSSSYLALLGDISIKISGQNPNFPSSNSWSVNAEYVEWTSGSECSKTLNVKLSWELLDGKDASFQKYNIYVQKLGLSEQTYEYLGSAHVKAFYVSGLTVPSGTNSLKFIIQVSSVDGMNQPPEDSPFLVLEVEKSRFCFSHLKSFFRKVLCGENETQHLPPSQNV